LVFKLNNFKKHQVASTKLRLYLSWTSKRKHSISDSIWKLILIQADILVSLRCFLCLGSIQNEVWYIAFRKSSFMKNSVWNCLRIQTYLCVWRFECNWERVMFWLATWLLSLCILLSFIMMSAMRYIKPRVIFYKIICTVYLQL